MQTRGSTLALKTRADITRSPKQRYQWYHKKVYIPKNKEFEKLSCKTIYTVQRRHLSINHDLQLVLTIDRKLLFTYYHFNWPLLAINCDNSFILDISLYFWIQLSRSDRSFGYFLQGLYGTLLVDLSVRGKRQLTGAVWQPKDAVLEFTDVWDRLAGIFLCFVRSLTNYFYWWTGYVSSFGSLPHTF